MSKDILFISSNRFDSFPSRKTRFSKFLSHSGFRVVYVESPHTYLAYLKKSKFANPGSLEKLNDNFYVLRSFHILPFFKKYRPLNAVDQKIFYKHINTALEKISFKPVAVFNYMPFFPDILSNFNSSIIYDCVDDHANFPGLINPDYVNELEKKTVALSDAVIVTGSKALKEKIVKFGKIPYVIPNGVDYKLFSSWLENAISLKIKKQIVYVGALSEWFDLELLEFLAQNLKEYEFLLIGFGPLSLDKLLKENSNIKFLGKLSQKAFAPILWESAASIIPFKVNDLTKKVDPLKAYEYLASGVPVVSTPIGNIENPYIYVGSTKEDFMEKLKIAIEEDSLEKRIKRTEFAKQFSWENRFNQLSEILGKLLNNHG